MSKPYIHAQASAHRYGGVPEDYIEIHNLMDSSKAAISDNRHRALTHNSWFIGAMLERIKFTNSCPPTGDNHFPTIINRDGRHVSVRDVAEDHCLEDFANRFIPTAQDFLVEMTFADWMNNGAGEPSSFVKTKPSSQPLPGHDVVYDGLGKHPGIRD